MYHTVPSLATLIFKPVWMTKTALRKVRLKHCSWIKYLNTKDGQDCQAYVNCRNTAHHATRRARRQHERKLAKECKKNNTGIWKYIRNRTNIRVGLGQLLKQDGSLTNSDREAAEVGEDDRYWTSMYIGPPRFLSFTTMHRLVAPSCVLATEQVIDWRSQNGGQCAQTVFPPSC